jgi:hypothetical protein
MEMHRMFGRLRMPKLDRELRGLRPLGQYTDKRYRRSGRCSIPNERSSRYHIILSSLRWQLYWVLFLDLLWYRRFRLALKLLYDQRM